MNLRLTCLGLAAAVTISACSAASDSSDSSDGQTSQSPITGPTGNAAEVIEPQPLVTEPAMEDAVAKTAKEIEPEPLSEALVGEFTQAVDAGAVIVDLRTSAEFVGGHIPGAQNVDATRQDFVESVRSLGEDHAGQVTYAMYHSDDTALQEAAQQLADAGITSVVPLPGGTQTWQDSGRLLVAYAS